MMRDVRTLSTAFLAAAEAHPHRAALIDRGRIYSYARLATAVHALAEELARAGIGRGDRVALVLPNGAEFVLAFFAITHVGGSAVPVSPSLEEPEIRALLGDARVSAVLTGDELRARCSAALHSACGLGEEAAIVVRDVERLSRVADHQSPRTAWPRTVALPDDAALCLYSSGSTGRPKPVVRSHANLLYEIDRLIAAVGLSCDDRVLGAAPFSHVNGLVRSMLASLLAGATLMPVPQFERRTIGRMISEQALTVFIGVPFMFAVLAETGWPRPVDFSSLRLCISASAPLKSDTSRRFWQQHGIYVRQLYGTTETGTIAVNLSPDVEESLDSVGAPLEGVKVEIFSDDRRVRPVGAVGEVGIQSPAAARGYLGAPEQTRIAFAAGYFFPGDMGRKDREGRIYLVGRKSLFINRGGYKVNPREIEEILERHPKVKEAVVLGVGTEHGDEKVKGIVVVTEPCGAPEIIDFCRGKLAPFKIPSIVEFRSTLPKGPTGKTLRTKL
jgi:long-chain acyl-CoA synthetase